MNPDLEVARAAADEAEARFDQHFDVCPTRRIGRPCLKCEQLDDAANHAESTYRRARLAVAAAVS